jgi:ABC-type uncharacterized transport system involved in gliding motility auxiliary subunit
MFTPPPSNAIETPESEQRESKPMPNIYANQYGQPYSMNNEMSINTIDKILEKEKQTNKTDAWNKLDKTGKIQKLHAFAEKYGKENGYPMKDIKALKIFFVESLEKNKLQKAKDLMYNKESGEISSIPALHFNAATRSFTLRILDNKRVSTLKSLTPKRINDKPSELVVNH